MGPTGRTSWFLQINLEDFDIESPLKILNVIDESSSEKEKSYYKEIGEISSEELTAYHKQLITFIRKYLSVERDYSKQFSKEMASCRVKLEIGERWNFGALKDTLPTK